MRPSSSDANADYRLCDASYSKVRAPGVTQVQLWLGTTADWTRAEIDALQVVLDEAELRRAASYYFESDRRTYILAHAVMRCALGIATGMNARAIEFWRSVNGRPELETKSVGAQPYFSLSHSRNLMAFALCRETTIGVDLEAARERVPAGVAERALSVSESRVWATLSEPERPEWLLRRWTLKEALLKAADLGSTCSPKAITHSRGVDSVSLSQAPPGVEFDAWSALSTCVEFGSENPKQRHVLGLCVHTARELKLELMGCRSLLAASLSQGVKIRGTLPREGSRDTHPEASRVDARDS
ncbi:MAG TPA: 4'-phosphopantetheinyl transferase superfamily protein [Polyangiaceae bacterium]|nr:4'-phosphopantetheinyl transferase superfamily protein [Polyangiaceae bacterium]